MYSILIIEFNNLAEWIYKIRCIYGQDDKNCEICGIKYEECDCLLEYTNFKMI